MQRRMAGESVALCVRVRAVTRVVVHGDGGDVFVE